MKNDAVLLLKEVEDPRRFGVVIKKNKQKIKVINLGKTKETKIKFIKIQ